MHEHLSFTGQLIQAVSANPKDLLAYLDPGSGSLLIQMIIAAAAGVAYTLRVQIGNFFRLFSGKKKDSDKKNNGKNNK